MLQDFIMWMQEPGKWNDAVVLLGVVAVLCLAGMIVNDKIEKRKAWKMGR